jgi:hypothetical protein
VIGACCTWAFKRLCTEPSCSTCQRPATSLCRRWCAPVARGEPAGFLRIGVMSPLGASLGGPKDAVGIMAPRTGVDPTLAITPRSRLTAMDQLKDQLTTCAEGRHTVDRLVNLAKERLEPALDEIRLEDARELGVWLNSRAQAGTAEAKIKWAVIRGVFETVRDARGPTLNTPFERPFSTTVSGVSLRPGLIGFSDTRAAPEIKIPAWPRKDPVHAEETMPLPADLQSALVPGPWQSTSFVWIALGVTVLFAFGRSYWLTKSPPSPPATANLAVTLPTRQLAVGLPALTDQSLPDQAAAVPTVAQFPVLELSRSPQFAIGSFPITHLLGLDLPATAEEPPLPTEPLPLPVLHPEPALNATSHYRASPVPTPGKSLGAAKF